MKDFWSKSQLRASAGGFYNTHRSPENEHGQRQGHGEKDADRERWTNLRSYNNRGDIPNQQSQNKQEPESRNQSSPNTDSPAYHFYIDPITNRRVSLGGRGSEFSGRNESQPGSKDVDTARHGYDTAQPDQNSSEHRPDNNGYTEGEATTYGGSRQSFPPEDRTTIDNSSVTNAGQNFAEKGPPELDDTHGKARLQFDDLKPPPAEFDETTSISADEIAQFIYDAEKHDGTSPHEVKRDTATTMKEHLIGSRKDASGASEVLKTGGTSTQEDSSPAISSLDSDQTLRSGDFDVKPTGYVEESVAPERLHEFPYIIEQSKPGDFPRSTVDDLRQKYENVEVKKYTAVRCLEPDSPSGTSTKSNSTAHISPIEHSQVTINEHGHEHSLSGISGKPYSDITDDLGPEFLEQLRERQMDESVSPKHRAWLESMEQLSHAMRQDEILSDTADREAVLAIRRAKAKVDKQHTSEKTFTGNYARDFPEEFEKSWTQILSSTPTENFDTTGQQTSSSEGQNMDGGLEGGFGLPEPARVQPALDRHHKVRELHADSLPQNSRNADTSYAGDRSESSAGPFYRMAGPGELSKDDGATAEKLGNSDDVNASSGTSTTLYKILVYDSTAQKVSIAETSSLVGDFTSALSPAAALSRLSHPTKFFPHFASLEADGFEIVSGSGDVLVFRKARPSAAEHEASRAEAADTSPAATDTTSEPYPPINPIDMTGRPKFVTPASANFASPTGYVAYPESEAVDLPPPPPRIKYNIDLRREEAVYSGPKMRGYGGQKRWKKSSVGKRILVGGVWVAGISYGLGVVSEYFTTGGIDGTGPTGF